jgi:hypothetical protein
MLSLRHPSCPAYFTYVSSASEALPIVSLQVMDAFPTSFDRPCDNLSLPTSERRLTSCQKQKLSKTIAGESLEGAVVRSTALESFVSIIWGLQLLQLVLEARFERSQLVIACVKPARGVQIPVAVCLCPQCDGDRRISEAHHHVKLANVRDEPVGDSVERAPHVRILVGIDDEVFLPVPIGGGVERSLAFIEDAATSKGKASVSRMF